MKIENQEFENVSALPVDNAEDPGDGREMAAKESTRAETILGRVLDQAFKIRSFSRLRLAERLRVCRKSNIGGY